MNNELLKRVEKLEDELQDLQNKLDHITTSVIILISKVDPKGYKYAFEDSFVDLDDDKVS